MAAAVVDRIARRRKAGIGECSDRDADATGLALLGVEQVRAADGTEAEPEPRPLIASAHVFRRLADHPVRSGKAGERREHATGPPLARQAMADADKVGLTVDLDPQLPAVAGRCPQCLRSNHRRAGPAPNAPAERSGPDARERVQKADPARPPNSQSNVPTFEPSRNRTTPARPCATISTSGRVDEDRNRLLHALANHSHIASTASGPIPLRCCNRSTAKPTSTSPCSGLSPT